MSLARLLRAGALLAIAALAGCRDAPSGAPPPAASAPIEPAVSASGDGEAAGVRFIERFTGGASAGPLPMIVALHGLGDNPRDFAHVYDGLPAKARLIVPYALDPWGDGFSWFPIEKRYDFDSAGPGIERAASRVARMIAALARSRPTVGKPIVTGFSQGGMLSYAIATRHPETIAGAYPLGGLLPPSLWPQARPQGEPPPIVAFHGDDDRVVSIEDDRRTSAKLAELGYRVDLREYPGTKHTISPRMRRDLHAALEAALARAPAP